MITKYLLTFVLAVLVATPLGCSPHSAKDARPTSETPGLVVLADLPTLRSHVDVIIRALDAACPTQRGRPQRRDLELASGEAMALVNDTADYAATALQPAAGTGEVGDYASDVLAVIHSARADDGSCAQVRPLVAEGLAVLATLGG